MGGQTSKNNNEIKSTNANATAMSLEIVLDKGVKQQIDKLSQYVSLYNSNDVKPLLQVVKDYKMNLETSTGKTYKLDNVEMFVGKFHQELLDKISKDFPNLSEQEKQLKLTEKLKDRGLTEYLHNIYDGKLGNLRDEILKNPLVVQDAKMASSIGNIFTDITGLKSKYKYFEYRYIQLNLFLIIFIQHTYNTMDKFINNILAYTITRDRVRQDSLRDLINLLLQLMQKAELNIDQKDFETIDQLMSVLEKQIADKQVDLNKAVENARIGAVDEMLKLVMANHDLFSDQTASQFSSQNPLSQNPLSKNPLSDSPNISDISDKNLSILNNPYKKEGPLSNNSFIKKLPQTKFGIGGKKQNGGFIRGHSYLPQTFYDLSTAN